MICTAVSRGPSLCKWLVTTEPAGVCCSQQCSADVSWKPNVELAMMLSRPVTLKQDCAAHRGNMSRLQLHCSADWCSADCSLLLHTGWDAWQVCDAHILPVD